MALVEEVIELRKQGLSITKTAEKLGKNRDYIRDICRDNSVGGVMCSKEITCEECGRRKEVKSNRGKFCSKSCSQKSYYKKNLQKAKKYSCNSCNASYVIKEGFNTSFCSESCYAKKNTHFCKWCNASFVKMPNRSAKCCSVECTAKHRGRRKTVNAIAKPKPINRLKKFMGELMETHNGELLPASEFKGLCEPMKFICLICEETHEKSEARYGIKYGCNCNASIGETKVRMALKRNKIDFKQQYVFEDCKNINPLPFDFAILEQGQPVALIEYDGKHHYEPVKRFGGRENLIQTQESDRIKTEYVKRNNLLLIRIPYWEQNNIEEILLNAFAMA